MNKYYQKFKEAPTEGSRHPVFVSFIDKFLRDKKDVNILTIGSERGDINSRAGEGWADFYWAELIKQNGGKLTIVDIDSEAIANCKKMLFDFVDEIDIHFVADDGLNWINKEVYDVIYLDSADDCILTLNCFLKIDRTKTLVLCDDASKGLGGKVELVKYFYPDYILLPCNSVHNMLYYPKTAEKQTIDAKIAIINGDQHPLKVEEDYKSLDRSKTEIIITEVNIGGQVVCSHYPDFEIIDGNRIWYKKVNYGDKSFKIGSLELDYIREGPNFCRRNERSVELALGKWFINKYNNNILEIGDVTCGDYGFFNGHAVLDPFGPYINSIRKDVLDYDYTGLNVLSISTFEHFFDPDYQNNDRYKGIKALEKVTSEAKSWLIDFPIGADRELENYLMNQDKIKYTFIVRENPRFEPNNWYQSDDKNLFYESYAHFSFVLSLYGSAKIVCVITNQFDLFL